MTDEEQTQAMLKVQKLATSLGLNGVMLLSPACPDCGGCHNFKVLTNLDEGEAPKLLAYFSEVTEGSPSEIIATH